MIPIYIPSLVILLAGIVLWVYTTPPKLQRAGEIMFAVGLLVWLMQGAPALFK